MGIMREGQRGRARESEDREITWVERLRKKG